MGRWMKHPFSVPGTRSSELATFEPLSHSDHAKAITESLFSLAPLVYKGLFEQSLDVQSAISRETFFWLYSSCFAPRQT